uniref:Putative secreted peptide n=1 Tax=Anopheles braziliensis TaxID=58242 RepID=A0A2M3ZX86_9DIPT
MLLPHTTTCTVLLLSVSRLASHRICLLLFCDACQRPHLMGKEEGHHQSRRPTAFCCDTIRIEQPRCWYS